MKSFFILLFLVSSIYGLRSRHRETPSSVTNDSSDYSRDGYDASLTLMAYFYNDLFDGFKLTDSDEYDFEQCVLGLASSRRSNEWNYGNIHNITYVMELVEAHFEERMMYQKYK